MSTRCRILCEKSHLTAPSVVHLTICFLPDSQHHRLSVKALLPLSPLQQFSIIKLIFIISPLYAIVNICNNILNIQNVRYKYMFKCKNKNYNKNTYHYKLLVHLIINFNTYTIWIVLLNLR